MNDQVEELSKILKNPVKLFVDSSISTVSSLKQEFIQLNEKNENQRFAIVACIIFIIVFDFFLSFNLQKF